MRLSKDLVKNPPPPSMQCKTMWFTVSQLPKHSSKTMTFYIDTLNVTGTFQSEHLGLQSTVPTVHIHTALAERCTVIYSQCFTALLPLCSIHYTVIQTATAFYIRVRNRLTVYLTVFTVTLVPINLYIFYENKTLSTVFTLYIPSQDF